VVPVLRTHILAFIAENFLNNEKEMQNFMSKSFYSHQYGNQRHINNIIEEILGELEEWEFVESSNREYRPTKLGKRVSELYIDPLSAKWMVDSLGHELDTIGTLYMVANTLEMRPYMKATREAEEAYAAYQFMTNTSTTSGDYYRMSNEYYPVRAFSTALMLHDWIEEQKEPEIVKKYASTPGAVYAKLTNADWLIYAAAELARILKKPQNRLIQTRVRLRYGIKEELLDLVRLEQIGRMRARMLFSNGIEKVADIEKNRDKVRTILGREIAERIFKQIE
jgi:helicase